MQGSCILRDSLLMGRAGQRREGLYKAVRVGVHRQFSHRKAEGATGSCRASLMALPFFVPVPK